MTINTRLPMIVVFQRAASAMIGLLVFFNYNGNIAGVR